MTDKIELTREQLRDAWALVFSEKKIGGYGAIDFIELQLFGPKSPREWWVDVRHWHPASPRDLLQARKDGLVLVREVLSDE
jgi:hypothetical protein